jgi:hypothetical protein
MIWPSCASSPSFLKMGARTMRRSS